MLSQKRNDFIPIMLGANLNSYSLAREFHEAYDVKSIVIGKYLVTQIIHSHILDFRQFDYMEDEKRLIAEVNKIASQNINKKILLLACSDTLVKIVMRNKNKFTENIIAPYTDYEKAINLMQRDRFYKLLDEKSLLYPKTFTYEKSMCSNYTLPFSFPIVLKPDNQQEYFANKFLGQKKVAIIENKDLLDQEINKIYNSGYTSTLTIQDFVPGDDTAMRVVNSYSDRNGKATFMSYAKVLLEEHTPTARGNYALIVNDQNEEVCNMLKDLLESIGYTGFANFDLKYDSRDNAHKLFEINCRQGNSHYHVTAGGDNVVKMLVEDRIDLKDSGYKVANGDKLFHIIPLTLAKYFINDRKIIREINQKISERKTINPLYYDKDMNIKRYYFLTRYALGQVIKYFKYFKNN